MLILQQLPYRIRLEEGSSFACVFRISDFIVACVFIPQQLPYRRRGGRGGRRRGGGGMVMYDGGEFVGDV